ncbi:MAG: sulfotransferase domain-containing protein [Bacteroidota bacterium]
MPRTASTFFQNEVFPHISDFNFVGVETTQYSQPFQRVLYQDESLYRKDEVFDLLNLSADQNYVFSNELFVGQSLYLNSSNRTRTALRLKQLFPEGEVVLFLRNQADLLESLYSIGVYSGHTSKPEEFIRFTNEDSSVNSPLYRTFKPVEQTEQYFYSSLIELYSEQFEKVNIFLYEDFKKDPEVFILRFCEKLNVQLDITINFDKSTNSSLSSRQLEYLRKTNSLKGFFDRSATGRKIFKKNVQTIEHRVGGSEKFHFAPALREKIKEHFAEDNERLLKQLPELKDSETFAKNYLVKG